MKVIININNEKNIFANVNSEKMDIYIIVEAITIDDILSYCYVYLTNY